MISTHTVVISGKAVKLAEKTICDTCVVKWRRYEFSDISAHIVVISPETLS